jgi:FAD:protein FMN transferase
MMLRSSLSDYRRLRPYLGTFVEVWVSGLTEDKSVAAINRAFSCIHKVETHMSAHHTQSDLGRLYYKGTSQPVRVHPWTYKVIQVSISLHELSGGVFDVTIGDVLEKRRLLPRWPSPQKKAPAGLSTDIELLSHHRIRLRRPVRFDLGGIAKGFAVDRAVEALAREGATAGCVNAGGDLKSFGTTSQLLLVRDPRAPQRLVRVGSLGSGAVATSADYFSKIRRRARRFSPLIDGRTHRQLNCTQSITVIAPSCMFADALTKVLAIDRQCGAMLLKKFHAHALILSEGNNGICVENLPPSST